MSDELALASPVAAVLARFVRQAEHHQLSLGEAIDSLHSGAYPMVALILVLPYLQPVPMGPLSIIGGITYALIGLQLWHGHKALWLPQRLRHWVLGPKTWRALLAISTRLVRLISKIARPRMQALVHGRSGQKHGAVILISAGLLMAIPFGVLPFNNMLPGLAIVFYSFGQLEQDGLMILIAWFWLIFTTIYFAIFFVALYFFGSQLWEHLLNSAMLK